MTAGLGGTEGAQEALRGLPGSPRDCGCGEGGISVAEEAHIK